MGWIKINILLILIIVIIIFMFGNNLLFSMGNRYKQKYTYKNMIYVKDYIYWSGSYWHRDKYRLMDDSGPVNSDNIIVASGEPESVKLPPVYERKDLVRIFAGIDKNDGERLSEIYTRRRSEDVIVREKELDKPYVRLGTFTVGGPTPPNWKKLKEEINLDGKAFFGADAVIVQRWEVLPFKQEDYWPITEFERPEFVRYYCVAVAFEETAKLPPGVVPFEPANDTESPKPEK